MANWAIVIGVDEYNDPNLVLRGAVNDALKMKEWLADASGGNVPEQNLFLFLSHDNRPEIPTNRKATKTDIERGILEIIRRSGGGGERLYFYFAGHGISTTENYVLTPAICPADFDERRPGNTTISISSIRDYFAAKQFQEQFFFFDACRNMPHRQQFRVGHFEAPDSPTPLPIQQTTIHATTPGGRAVESPNDESGVFTDVLIRGLRGEGKSKVYDATQDRYLVKDDRLLAFIREEVEKKFQTHEDKEKYKPQIENRLDTHPIIVSFPSTIFPSVELGVKTSPSNLSPIEVSVRAGIPSQKSNTHPVRFRLPQDDYGVIVSAVDHTQSRKPWPVYLYSTQEITVDMTKNPFTPKNTDTINDLPPDTISTGLTTDKANQTGIIEVSSTDSFAPIQIANHIGNVVANGLGDVRHTGSPGLYKVRLVSPNEKYEKIVELKPNKINYIRIESPNRPDVAQELVNKTNFRINSDNSLEISEHVGSVLEPKLTTILALASRFADRDISSQRLSKFGFTGFRQLAGAHSGLSLSVGSELRDHNKQTEFIWDLRVRFWSQSDMVPSMQHHPHPSRIDGFGEFAIPAPPGSYWISIESKNTEPLIFSIVIPRDRIALVTLTHNKDGSKSMFQYLPDSGYPLSIERDVSVLRKINFMQQFYAKNALEYLPSKDIIDLAYMKWEDPMAGCLAGYLLLKDPASKHRDILKEIGKNMSRTYREIPDSFVLDARIREMTGMGDPMQAYEEALRVGIPLFVDGLNILYYAIKKHDRLNNTPFASLVKFVFERRNVGTPWTCFNTSLKPNTILGR